MTDSANRSTGESHSKKKYVLFVGAEGIGIFHSPGLVEHGLTLGTYAATIEMAENVTESLSNFKKNGNQMVAEMY